MGEEHDPDAYLTLGKAARLAGVNRSTLLRRIEAGRLRHLRAGTYYITTLRWIAESEVPGPMGRPPKRLPDHLRAPSQDGPEEDR